MYQGRTFIRESVYVCGNYMDADIYPVFQKPGRRRSRCKPTSEIQRRLNQKNAEKRLTRLVHTNFTEDDIALHLTYRPGEEPETKEGSPARSAELHPPSEAAVHQARQGVQVYQLHGIRKEDKPHPPPSHHQRRTRPRRDREAVGTRLCKQHPPAVRAGWRNGPCALHCEGQTVLPPLEPKPEPDTAGACTIRREDHDGRGGKPGRCHRGKERMGAAGAAVSGISADIHQLCPQRRQQGRLYSLRDETEVGTIGIRLEDLPLRAQ